MFLKENTQIDGKNGIKNYATKMGLTLSPGQIDQIHEHMECYDSEDSVYDDIRASVKTETDRDSSDKSQPDIKVSYNILQNL